MLPNLIFDLDGLLSDTESLHMKAYVKALSNISIELSEDEYADHWIRQGLGIEQFIEKRNLALSASTIRNAKSIIYQDLLHSELKPMPGMQHILGTFHGKTGIALATTSSAQDAHYVLTRLDIVKYFQAIITQDDVTIGKPAPDIFVKAASRLGVNPTSCVVIEDAEKGIIAAHSAGMRSVAIPNTLTATNNFNLASETCYSLFEATELIKKMAVA